MENVRCHFLVVSTRQRRKQNLEKIIAGWSVKVAIFNPGGVWFTGRARPVTAEHIWNKVSCNINLILTTLFKVKNNTMYKEFNITHGPTEIKLLIKNTNE